jgi:hypothetical protein
LIPLPAGMWIPPPPPPPGSGKFVTPWARMQAANAIPADRRPDPDPLLDLLEEPQAAIASAQPRAANAIGGLRRLHLAAALRFTLRNVVAFPQIRSVGRIRVIDRLG